MDILTPEALKRLVERLRSPLLPTFDDCREAAAAISGLMAERDALAQIAGERLIEMESMNRQTHNAFDRAEQAEAKLREIEEICATQAGMTDASADKGKSLAASHVRGKALDRIATIARSTSQGGEG